MVQDHPVRMGVRGAGARSGRPLPRRARGQGWDGGRGGRVGVRIIIIYILRFFCQRKRDRRFRVNFTGVNAPMPTRDGHRRAPRPAAAAPAGGAAPLHSCTVMHGALKYNKEL